MWYKGRYSGIKICEKKHFDDRIKLNYEQCTAVRILFTVPNELIELELFVCHKWEQMKSERIQHACGDQM